MANESRFLGKQVVRGEGIIAQENGAAMVLEDGAWTLIGGQRIGDGGTPIAIVASVLASCDFGAMDTVGSQSATAAVDVVLAGVIPGDQVFASPIQSLSTQVTWAATCFSAGAVQVRCVNHGSGALDLAATNWRVSAIRFK